MLTPWPSPPTSSPLSSPLLLLPAQTSGEGEVEVEVEVPPTLSGDGLLVSPSVPPAPLEWWALSLLLLPFPPLS